MTGSAKGYIYIIEDNPTWATTLMAHLNKMGYKTESFASGEEFFKKVNSNKEIPEIVIIDYHLEGKMTGLDVLQSVKKINPRVYAIMFSGQESLEIALKTLDFGAYDYVVKGEDAIERLKMILQNIERTGRYEKESKELTLKIQKAQIGIVAVILLIVIVGMSVYLYLCPETRLIKWDPFGRGNQPDCAV